MEPLGRALNRRWAELDARQAARPALLGDDPVSYGELADEVALLAGGLAAAGARPGDRVAIWLDKQPRYAEAILATLWAGCVYVPLDGGQPALRVRTILADAEPVVLVVGARQLATLGADPLPPSIRTVVTDADTVPAPGGASVLSWAGLRRSGPLARPVEVGNDDLAALLYTSGSTGTPKGVMISHRNLGAFVGWAGAELDLRPDDVFANHASFNFDLSTFDLFAGLLAGGAVWIVEDALAREPAALAAGIRRHGVTVWYSVPSVLHLMAGSGALTPSVTRQLRYVLFAGEAFPPPQLRALATLLPPRTALYNLYGPTETNVCTYHRVEPADLETGEPLPLGRPVAGARLSIVDGDGRAVTVPGEVGELVVEGDCVTPGYWRREDDPVAVQHRHGRHPTGDLVSCSGGLLRYHGRRDRMVKVSGHRVELDEIEAAALRHPAVATSAVVLAGPRLVLYYTLRPGERRPGLVELKQHCARHLPRYMVPQLATCLSDLPRSANGKTDYRRLCAVAAT